MDGFTGLLPTKVGGKKIIRCTNCKKAHEVTYHGQARENDTYVYKCSCNHELFTETNGEGYRVIELEAAP